MPWDLAKTKVEDLGKIFDYSVLPKQSTIEDMRKGCELSRKYNFASFCLSSGYWVPYCVEQLKGTDVKVGAAIGFPFGVATGYAKAKETEEAVKLGSTTFDTVMNIGALLSNQFDVVREELRLFKEACQGFESKCILETCYLSDDYLRAGTEMIAEAGLDFAKTSSGQYEGPTLEHVLIMKEVLKGTNTKIKVAGVKFPRPQNAAVFLLAGADRIGTRAAPEIIEGFKVLRDIGMIPQLEG